MCGIVGYYGENAFDPIFDILQRLEYRGYDSVGVAIYDGNEVRVSKAVGTVESLFKKIKRMEGSVGIGHTRWATHGEVSIKNTHPFRSNKGRYFIVHNGIIDNFLEIKKELIDKGYEFESNTDSEVIANFLEEFDDIKVGILSIFKRFKGTYAVVGISNDGMMYGFKKDEPLVVGISNGTIVASSDPNSISHIVDKVTYLEDGEGFIVRDGYLEFFSENGDITKKFVRVNKKYKIEKVRDYTLKEINEIKMIKDYDYQISFNKFNKIILTGAGSSYNASLFGSLLFLSKGINSFSILSSEIDSYINLVDNKSLILAISQSGETADTLRAVKIAREKGAKIYSIVNVPNSTLDRISDRSFYMSIGPEVGVVATKSFISTIKILGSLVGENYKIKDFDNLFLNLFPISKMLSNKEHLYILGTGIGFPLAREGALKIKEISYVHAEAFECGELKHGNIALIEKNTSVFGIVSDDRVIRNLMEVKSRGAFVIGISKENNPIFDFWIRANNPIEWVIPFQIIGYEISRIKGLNPDRPRNLAKSVVVL